MKSSSSSSRPDRRQLLGAAAAALATTTSASAAPRRQNTPAVRGATGRPTMVGSANALAGMKLHYKLLAEGSDPLDAAIEVVKVTEANPQDSSVGIGGLPNEEGAVALDAAVMHGPTHNAGSVACIENILHPSEVARLVMERTDHCMLVGRGAYDFARSYGHPHTELLTENARKAWMGWRESMSDRDDRLSPDDEKQGNLMFEVNGEKLALADLYGKRITGTIHCSALSTRGEIACTTTTSGLAWKIPGRVGDSPIIGAGLYCDNEAGSAGATGRGEAAILSSGSAMIVELMRQGASPQDAGLEVLARVQRQTQRASSWQKGLVDGSGRPTFNLQFYVLGLDGTTAGVTLRGGGSYAVADPEGGPRHESLVPLNG